jgi:hypothetical protein
VGTTLNSNFDSGTADTTAARSSARSLVGVSVLRLRDGNRLRTALRENATDDRRNSPPQGHPVVLRKHPHASQNGFFPIPAGGNIPPPGHMGKAQLPHKSRVAVRLRRAGLRLVTAGLTSDDWRVMGDDGFPDGVAELHPRHSSIVNRQSSLYSSSTVCPLASIPRPRKLGR